jgi:hypothetical protein
MIKPISSTGTSLVKKRIAFCVVSACVLVFLAACGGAGEEQKEAQQAPQEPNQQAAQPSPPTQSSGGAASGLIGTWQITHINGNPLPDQYDRMTFSEDGTMQSTSAILNEAGLDLEVPPVQYSILNDTRLQITPREEDGAPYVQEYSLEGDTLTFYTPDPEFPIQQTFKRTS